MTFFILSLLCLINSCNPFPQKKYHLSYYAYYGHSFKKYLFSICYVLNAVQGTEEHKKIVKSLSCVRLFAAPMDSSQPGSSVHVIFQARILEWVAISFSRGSSWPRDRTLFTRINNCKLINKCYTASIHQY